MNKFYVKLARSLDTGLIGILVGVVTSIAVNIATGDKLDSCMTWAMIFSIIAVIMLVIVMQIRQRIDDRLSSFQNLSSATKWEDAIDFENKRRKIWFFIALVGFVVFFGLSVYKIVEEREATKTEQLSSNVNQ